MVTAMTNHWTGEKAFFFKHEAGVQAQVVKGIALVSDRMFCSCSEASAIFNHKNGWFAD